MSLPTPGPIVIESVESFLIKSIANNDNDDLFYVIAEHQNNSSSVVSSKPVNKKEIIEACKELKLAREWEILLVPFCEFTIEGTIIIKNNNSIFGETSRDGIIAITRSKISPEFSFHMDPFLRTMKYSFDDHLIRIGIWNAIKFLSHDKQSFRESFIPGYYEFALKKRSLEPVFLDARIGNF